MRQFRLKPSHKGAAPQTVVRVGTLVNRHIGVLSIKPSYVHDKEAVLDIAGGLLLTLYGSSTYRAGMRGALGAVLLTLYGRSTNRGTACDTSLLVSQAGVATQLSSGVTG